MSQSTFEYKLNNDNNTIDNILLTDKDIEYELELYCYDKDCNNDSDKSVKNFRGVVFHKQEIVMKSFPYTEEYTSNHISDIPELQTDFTNCKFYDSYEGTLLRLFFWKDKWFLSTHRKLNAFKTKWATVQSFGILFCDALRHEFKNNLEFSKIFSNYDMNECDIFEIFKNNLNKNNKYMFLLKNQYNNIIVCDSPSDSYIYHIGTFINEKLDMNDNIHLNHLSPLYFSNIEEIKTYIDNIDIKKTQGVICLTENTNFKIFNENYYDLFKLRGNEPSINFRYLQLRNQPDLKNKIYQLYPHKIPDFELYEKYITEIAKELMLHYHDRYVLNKFLHIPQNEHIIITKCNKWYIKNPRKNIVTVKTILFYLNNHPHNYLNYMIKNYTFRFCKKNTPSYYPTPPPPPPSPQNIISNHDSTPYIS
jgi:hypothetical protein